MNQIYYMPLKLLYLILLFSHFTSFGSKGNDLLRAKEKEVLEQMEKCRAFMNKASAIVNSAYMSNDDFNQRNFYISKALVHASKVDTKFLDKKLKNWGEAWSTLTVGLRLQEQAYKNRDNAKNIKGTMYVEKYKDWYKKNLYRIKSLKSY